MIITMKPYCQVREGQTSNYKVNIYHLTMVAMVLPSIINKTHRNSRFYKIRLCMLHRNINQSNSCGVLVWACYAQCIFLILYPCPIYSCWYGGAKSKYGKEELKAKY